MKKIKVTDYLIEFLINKGVDCLFGYPGGVICHFMDSAGKYSSQINMHVPYHEQSAAFAACSYAQAKNNIGVAFATSGPGATNLITGIADAWFDSIPVIFITGQVDTYALRGELQTRQLGFQETDIVSIVSPITKYCVRVDDPNQIQKELEKAFHKATTGRKGPVLIDIPADVQRAIVDIDDLEDFNEEQNCNNSSDFDLLLQALSNAKRPVILAGAGIKQGNAEKEFRTFAEKWQIPVISSLPAIDLIEYDNPLQTGFVGVNGHRYANIVLAKSDLIIAMGNRLDVKQIGAKRNFFRKEAKIVRIDIDAGELSYKVNEKEINIQADIKNVLEACCEKLPNFSSRDSEWINITNRIKKELEYINDNEKAHSYLRKFSKILPDNVLYTLDVGQNEIWAAQALEFKKDQRIFMSAGLGTMGYALPAAIGAYYATKRPVACIVGDGGLQMNIQELQFISQKKLPISILLLNNKALGMIRQFQEKNFEAKYLNTTCDSGYSVPDFKKIVEAYGINYSRIESPEEVDTIDFDCNKTQLYELVLPEVTYLQPSFGSDLIYDQEPKIDRELFNKLMTL